MTFTLDGFRAWSLLTEIQIDQFRGAAYSKKNYKVVYILVGWFQNAHSKKNFIPYSFNV